MRIDGFGPADEFKSRVDEWIKCMRETKPAAGTDGPLIPGDCERENERERSANGIPLSAAVVATLDELSRKTGVPF
jgi:LDH2 family malate/lactate/ureidoglycolate dehydrogenase